MLYLHSRHQDSSTRAFVLAFYLQIRSLNQEANAKLGVAKNRVPLDLFVRLVKHELVSFIIMIELMKTLAYILGRVDIRVAFLKQVLIDKRSREAIGASTGMIRAAIAASRSQRSSTSILFSKRLDVGSQSLVDVVGVNGKLAAG